jgi:hypothetical protein
MISGHPYYRCQRCMLLLLLRGKLSFQLMDSPSQQIVSPSFGNSENIVLSTEYGVPCERWHSKKAQTRLRMTQYVSYL